MMVEDLENSDSHHNTRNLALLGLVLVSIAPSISVTTGFVFKAGLWAVIVFVFTKAWVFGLHVLRSNRFHGRLQKKAGGAFRSCLA